MAHSLEIGYRPVPQGSQAQGLGQGFPGSFRPFRSNIPDFQFPHLKSVSFFGKSSRNAGFICLKRTIKPLHSFGGPQIQDHLRRGSSHSRLLAAATSLKPLVRDYGLNCAMANTITWISPSLFSLSIFIYIY